MSGYRIRITQRKSAVKPVVENLTKHRRLHRGGQEILYKPKQAYTHPLRATHTHTRTLQRQKTCPRKSGFSPPPSLFGKRYAAAVPSLACLGRTPSGMQGALHRNQIWRTWYPSRVAACWPGGVSSRVSRAAVGRGGFRPKTGSLETPQVGNSAECPLPSLCRSGLRCDCGMVGGGGATSNRIAQPQGD